MGGKRQAGPGDFQDTERSIMPLKGDPAATETSEQEKTSAFHDASPSSREGGEGDQGQSCSLSPGQSWVHQGSATPDQPDGLLT